MLDTRLALVTNVPALTMGELLRVSAALQKQLTRDLWPIWGIPATIDAFATLEDVPVGYWKVLVVDDVPGPSTGVHDWSSSEPVAWVERGPTWSLAASHEVLEMIVDPWGQRLAAGNSPVGNHDRVEFLVEVCDPSGDAQNAYTVDGLLVSDFYTPQFFDPVQASGVRYSFTGGLDGPRRIVKGGYLSWRDPISGAWFRHHWFDAERKTENLGPVPPGAASVRAFLDAEPRKRRALYRADVGRERQSELDRASKSIHDAGHCRAHAVREQTKRGRGRG